MDEEIQQMYVALINDLRAVQESTANVIDQAKQSARLSRDALSSLKEYIIVHPFESNEEEVSFFKDTKPRFHCHLAYWASVLEIELNRPIGSKKALEKYLRLHLLRLKLSYEAHAGFYSYYRSGETGMDDRYFLRENNSFSLHNPRSVDSDPQFTTSHDWPVTQLMAGERLQQFLNQSIASPDNPLIHVKENTNDKPLLQWTASKAALVELIYAFQSQGVFNNGQAGIREIALHFEKLFGIGLGNFYNVFNEIRLR
jgi:hypothetical protein